MPISQLRVQKYSVGDRVEADWKAEGEFFRGASRAVKKDAYYPYNTTTATSSGMSMLIVSRPLIRVDEERIRSVVRRVPLEKREAVLREAIARVEASLPKSIRRRRRATCLSILATSSPL